MEETGRRRGLWALLRRVPLRSQMSVIVVTIIVTISLLCGATLVIVTLSTRRMQAILNDNQASYRLQQAMAAETRAFEDLAYTRSGEVREAYNAAAAHTVRCLEAMPYDYVVTGERRYGLTWTIRNSYGQYTIQRDKVLAMNPEDTGYIGALYQAYSMQDYLSQYCAGLTQIVLEEGSTAYAAESSFYLSIPSMLVTISLVAIVVLPLVLHSTMGSVFGGLIALTQAAGAIEHNDFDGPDLHWESDDEMGRLVRSFNKMKHANAQYLQATQERLAMEDRLHREEVERVDLERRFSDTRFQLIKSQLNPHFLFNTLNTIARMARIEDAPVSEQMTVSVSNLLRYNLSNNDSWVPLSRELKVVEDYMYIQQMRFDERVRYRVDCAVDPDTTRVPVFLLQPLVENAVIHGLSPKEEGGEIRVRVRRLGDRLRVTVADTGVGMSPERLVKVREALLQDGVGLGIGLGNVCKRVLGYCSDGTMNIYSRPDVGTVVLLQFGEGEEG